jgi:starvation-inducible DNA-binding protein
MLVAARKTTTPAPDPGAARFSVSIETSTDLWQTSLDLCEALNALIADAFALYLKTKNFQWHVSGPHFRDYYLLFEEQATQILPMTDAIAQRVRKNGARTLRSIGHIVRMQRLRDNDRELLAAPQMLGELTVDNAALARSLEEAHELCEQQRDVATASLIEGWIDEAQNRVWFLREAHSASGEL